MEIVHVVGIVGLQTYPRLPTILTIWNHLSNTMSGSFCTGKYF